MPKFELSVIEPVKGKPGRVMFTYTKCARNINEAVESVRSEIAGSGWAVLQSHSLAKKREEAIPA